MENTSSFPLGGLRGLFLFRAKLAKEQRRKGFFLKHKVFLLNKVVLLIGKYFQLPPWGIEGATPFTFGYCVPTSLAINQPIRT
jgi:hypothetical protein